MLSALTIFPPGVKPPTTTTTTPPPTTAPPVSATSCQPLTVTGRGWKPGTKVTIIFDEGADAIGLAAVTADVNGAFTAVVTVPDVQAGRHLLVLVGTSPTGLGKQQSQVVNVTAGCTATSNASGTLPRTGSSTLPITLFGVALMGAGIALVLSQRRRLARH